MRVAVVGSGPAGVAAATVLLETGYAVDIFDGGREPEPEAKALQEQVAEEVRTGVRPTPATYRRLHWAGRKKGLASALGGAVADVLGKPDAGRMRKRLWGSDFTFSGTDVDAPIAGIDIAQSLAVGGLSNAWGAACYRFRSGDIDAWPIDRRALDPWYARAEGMLGLTTGGGDDGSADPYADGDVSAHGTSVGHPTSLRSLWDRHRDVLGAAGLRAGPARLAIDETAGSARSCRRCGLCVYGCPIGSIWTARQALSDLRRTGPRLTAHHGALVQAVRPTADGVTLTWSRAGTTETSDFAAVFLAAGPLATARIVVRSTGAFEKPMPLLDSDVYVIPFRLDMPWRLADDGIALSRGVLALDPEAPGEAAAHLQLYGASPGLLGSAGNLAMLMPQGLRDRLLRRIVVGMLFFDSRESRRLEADVRRGTSAPDVVHIRETAPSESRQRVRRILQRIKEHGDRLGLRPLLGLAVGMPAGTSFHLGGTLPMRNGSADMLQTDPAGAITGLPNCYAVDASGFPTMPAQNPTLSIMANAMRVAAGFAAEASGRGAQGSGSA